MSRRFQKSGHVVERRIRDEHILVPIMKNMASLDGLYALNETAAVVWRLAAEGLPESDIAIRLADEFDVSAATAAADTARVLDELLNLGALEPAAG